MHMAFRTIFLNAKADLDWLATHTSRTGSASLSYRSILILMDTQANVITLRYYHRAEPVFLEKPDDTKTITGAAGEAGVRMISDRFSPK